MTELFMKIKRGSLWTSVLCIVFGILFCIWPGEMLLILCRLVGVVLTIAGIVLLGMALAVHEPMARSLRLIPGVICLVIGVWIIGKPGTFIVLIPILIGILLIYHGVKDVLFCLEVKKGEDSKWWFGLIFAIITLAVGLFLVCNSWFAVKVSMVFVGIVLIYDGVCGLWLNQKASKTAKNFRSDDVIDVDYKEE